MSKINTSFTLPKQSDEATTYEMLKDDLTPASLWKKLWPDENYDNLVFAQNHFLLYEDDNFTSGNVYPSRDISAKFSAGRYFVRDAEGYLRQMQVEHGENGIEYSVSRPLTNVEVPPAPSFLTELFAFFGHQASKAAIQTYNETTAFAAAFSTLVNNPEKHINLNPPRAEFAEETLASTGAHVFDVNSIQNDSIQNDSNEVWISNDMPHAEFINHLHAVKHYRTEDFKAVLDNENVTAADIVDAQVKLMTAEFAQRLLALDNLDKEHMQHTFAKLTEHLKDVVEMRYGSWIDGYVNALSSKDPDKITVARVNVEQVAAYSWEDKAKHVNGNPIYDTVVRDITEKMDAVKFKNKQSKSLVTLKNAAKYTVQDAKDLLKAGNYFPQVYKQAFTNLLEAQAAKMLLQNDNLDEVKPSFTELHKKVTDFVEKTYGERIEKNFNAGLFVDPEISKWSMENLIDEVNKNGLKALLNDGNPVAQNKSQNNMEAQKQVQQSEASHSNPSLIK